MRGRTEKLIRAYYRRFNARNARRPSSSSAGGVEIAAFCAVRRPDDHPMKPKDYVPLDRFWEKRGYARHPDLVARFHWRDLTDGRDSEKPLVFWLKNL